jgi:hypothetical protein
MEASSDKIDTDSTLSKGLRTMKSRKIRPSVFFPRNLFMLVLFLTLSGLQGCGGNSSGSNGTSGGSSSSSGSGTTTTSTPTPPSNSVPAPSFRTRYIRTDANTEHFLWINSSWIVFDSPTNRFFVSDPFTNRVSVLDAAKESLVGTIFVPGAYGLDETPDHTVLYAATQIGDVYAIDPKTMQVTHRYVASQIGPSGYRAYSVRVLANGELALLGSQGGIPNIDGYGSLAIWNPSTNQLTAEGCIRNIGVFTVTGDRSLVVVASVDSDGTICTINPVTGQQIIAQSGTEFVFSIAPTPDGKSLLVPTGPTLQVSVIDAHTLKQTSVFNVNGDAGSAGSMIVSPDSSTLYMENNQFVYAYNISSGTQIGWLPSLTVEHTSGGIDAVSPLSGPVLQAFDNTGLLAGPMEEGVGFLDTTVLRTGSVGAPFSYDYLTPATGPAAGGTQVQLKYLSAASGLAAAYFGGQTASSVSGGYATTPAGSHGSVDFYGVAQDGGTVIIPEGFSYGPTIVEVTPNATTAEGGGTGIIYGYGFGPTAILGPTGIFSQLPADVQVLVGGKQATITGFAPNAYNLAEPPFSLQALSYTIPSGLAGTSSDVTVATANGTATASGKMQYLPGVQQFSLTGASLAQGVYDASRDVYYFTDAAAIRVFSRTTKQWLTSIQVPAPPSGASHRLWGISLSADGSKLAVSDTGTSTIYVFDPDTPASAQSFTVPTGLNGYVFNAPQVVTYPAGLAITNSGDVYYAAYSSLEGYDGFFKLSTSTGKFTVYNVVSFAGNQPRTALTADNSRVYFNNDGEVFSIDTTSDALTYASVDPNCCYGDYDLALSADQKTLEATSYLYDSNLNAKAYLALNIREGLSASYVYGVKLSADGTMLFQPSTSGIDGFDGRLGTLLTRVSLPVTLSQNFDALVSDGKDNVLIGITGQAGSGVAIIDLSSLTEPSPLPYEQSTTALLNKAGTESSLSHSSSSLSPRVAPNTIARHVHKQTASH